MTCEINKYLRRSVICVMCSLCNYEHTCMLHGLYLDLKSVRGLLHSNHDIFHTVNLAHFMLLFWHLYSTYICLHSNFSVSDKAGFSPESEFVNIQGA